MRVPFAIVSTTTDPNGSVTTLAHNAVGWQTSLTDPVGNVTGFTYDENGNVVTRTDPLGHDTTFVFNELNQLVSTTDRNGRQRDITYDDVGNVLGEIWYADAGITVVDTLSFTYDDCNRQLTATNSAGTQTQEFNALGQVIHVSQLTGVDLDFTYDPVGNRIEVADSNGTVETSTYDLANQLRRRQQSPVTWVDFFYDANGRQIVSMVHKDDFSEEGIATLPVLAGLIVNAGDQMLAGVQRSMLTSVLAVFSEPVTLDSGAFTIDFQPDVSINYGSGTTIGEIPDLTWSTSDGGVTWLITFSGDGVVAGCIADGVYVLTTHHDAVHGSTGDMAADRDNILHRFFGDIDGNGVVNGTWGDGDVFDVSYGASTGDPSFLYGFDFDLSGTIDSPDSTAFTANLGTTWSWTTLESVIIAYSATRFDAAGNVLEYISGDAYEDETVKFVYTYDAAHRQTSQTRNGVTNDYDYDDGGQLTGEDSSLVTAAYTYDANGNRTMSGYTTGDGAGGDPDANRVTSDGIWDYTYDDEGNLIQRSSIGTSELWLYEYDNRNHLIQAVRKTDGTTTDLTVIYSYDAWGNRVSKSVDSGGGAVQLSFVLDGWNPAKAGSVGLSRFDVWADVDGDVVTQYMRGDLIDQLIGRSDLVTPYDGTYWYLTDVLGTVRGITNKWGQLIDAIDYDAFGNIVGETQPDYTGRYGFGGREYDAETGFYSNRDRQYNPQTGRFNQEDPISFRAGDPNIYRYVHNAPTNGTDPSGRIVMILLAAAAVTTVYALYQMDSATAQYNNADNLLKGPIDDWTPEVAASYQAQIGQANNLHRSGIYWAETSVFLMSAAFVAALFPVAAPAGSGYGTAFLWGVGGGGFDRRNSTGVIAIFGDPARRSQLDRDGNHRALGRWIWRIWELVAGSNSTWPSSFVAECSREGDYENWGLDRSGASSVGTYLGRWTPICLAIATP